MVEKIVVIPRKSFVDKKIALPVTVIVSKTVPATIVELKTMLIEYHTLYSSSPVTIPITRPVTVIVSSIKSIVAENKENKQVNIKKIGVGKNAGGAG